MTEAIKDVGINWFQRLKQAWTQLLTWVNGLFTLIAFYVMSDPTIQAKFMPFVPQEHQDKAAILFPIIIFWIVQKAKEMDRQRTITQTRLHS